MDIQGQFEFVGGRASVSLHESCRLTDAARHAGVVLNTSCAGRGHCGGCTVDLLEGTFVDADGATFVVDVHRPRRVHGCKTRVISGPFRVFVPRRSMVETGEKVVCEFTIDRQRQFLPTIAEFNVTLPKPTLGHAAATFESIAKVLQTGHSVHLLRPSLEALASIAKQNRYEKTSMVVRVAWRHDDSWELIGVWPEGTAAKSLGLAVDIGTTTVAVSLIDMTTGQTIDSISAYNQQIQMADDVASRIQAASTPEGLTRLQRLLIDDTLNPMIDLLCRKHRASRDEIVRTVISGNTVMWNLFLAIDPTSLGHVPFVMAGHYPGAFRARELGLYASAEGFVDVVPSISAYVGGDIVSDIYATGIDISSDAELLIDVGTNGEIALWANGQSYVTACAAGPAFEGLRIACGMRASIGAVERVTIDPATANVRIHVIGETKPVGVCGSGLIDALGQLLLAGLLEPSGRFRRDRMADCRRLRQCADSAMLEFVLVPAAETDEGHTDITLTEGDVQTLLAAKAAVFSAVRLLLAKAGIEANDLRAIHLAGGFAKYIDIDNAIAIGLFPEIDREKYHVIGNTSLAGAILGLTDRTVWPTFREILKRPETVELNLESAFQDEYTFALFLPNLMTDLFPKTQEILESRS